MRSDSRFIIIAGTARNVGKTTLACKVIKSIEPQKVVALKLISLKKHQETHHHYTDTFLILEEKNRNSSKDTAKMLRAGAQKAFLILSQENYIEKAIDTFLSFVQENDLIIVESAMLRNYLTPYCFIIVDRKAASNKKRYIDKLKPLADYFIDDIYDEYQSVPILEDIKKGYR
jgi:tRNA uridine 5-carbamoylmethylation protein Kti12